LLQDLKGAVSRPVDGHSEFWGSRGTFRFLSSA